MGVPLMVGVLGPVVGFAAAAVSLGLLQELGLVPAFREEIDESAIPRAVPVSSRAWPGVGIGRSACLYAMVFAVGNLVVAGPCGVPLVPAVLAGLVAGPLARVAHQLCVLDDETSRPNLAFWAAAAWFITAPSLLNTITLSLLT